MRKPNYDRNPFIGMNDYSSHLFAGYEKIACELKRKINSLGKTKVIITVDTYPGVYDDEILGNLERTLNPVLTVRCSEANYNNGHILKMISRNLTEDRVRGVLSHHNIEEFFDPKKIRSEQNKIKRVKSGTVLVYGTGASLVSEGDILVYADLARWELQLRYRRKEISNWCASNAGEDWMLMYKRGFFVDWRVADKHKRKIFGRIDYLLDTNVRDNPKMITAEALWKGLERTVNRPFRVVPYFDEGPWGGQWMKEVCGLDKSMPNYAWCFDCVPEENSLYLGFGEELVEIPSVNLVYFHPIELLGDRVHARFGEEFPIRFDFLDTMEGGNLSLQVHPTTGYIQDNFGMHYTQDESYYMLDACDDACVYLGLKEGVDKDEMVSDLERAQEGGIMFDAEKYVNRIPAKKHDHFLIPGGTVHCSGANSMVLEISATPYIFTFKLWDWGRVGLDGRPRPIHIDHGKNVINPEWTTDVIMKKHVNCFEKIGEGDGWFEERTGLHDREFIETRRHWFCKPVHHQTGGGVNVLNLVEGEEAVVESPDGRFEPFVVHYAETFIIPAGIGNYTIRPCGASEGRTCATVKAYVRV